MTEQEEKGVKKKDKMRQKVLIKDIKDEKDSEGDSHGGEIKFSQLSLHLKRDIKIYPKTPFTSTCF